MLNTIHKINNRLITYISLTAKHFTPFNNFYFEVLTAASSR